MLTGCKAANRRILKDCIFRNPRIASGANYFCKLAFTERTDRYLELSAR